MGPKFGKKDKLGLGKCHLRKCLYFAIFINYIFCSIIQLNIWCVFHHSIQPKITKITPFSSNIASGILPVIPFCKRSVKQKEIGQTNNKTALHQFHVLPHAIHCCCEHWSLFLQTQRKSFHLQSHQKLHI